MALVKRFEDLVAWREARAFSGHAYRITRSARFVRDRELASQLRRAALSTVTNIAEGCGSGSKSEFRRFLRYAIRSAVEVQGCLDIAADQEYLERCEFDRVYGSAERVKSLCSALVRRHSTAPTTNGSGRVAEAAARWCRQASARPHVRTSAPDLAG